MQDQGIRSRIKRAAVTATAALQSIELEGCRGLRTVIELYPRPLESNEVELIFIPDRGEPVSSIEQLRSVGDVLSGGSVRTILLDDRNALPIRGRLFFARASGADADVEVRISIHTVDLPKE